jgi:L-lactate dehydrogenase complex protein LldE
VTMRVSLFVTCLADQLWPAAAVGAVEVLRRVGCSVEFDERQTCCGQPAFNTGYRSEARALARRLIEIFESSGADAIVSPSGSCTAMLHHYEQLFEDVDWRARARRLAERTHELSSFLVNRLGVEDVGASFPGRLTWHDACHGLRDLGIRDEPRRLLRHVRGAELVELSPSSREACCGFGGTFSVKYPELSVAILDEKVDAIERASVDAVVSGDASCLMQIGGRLSRRGSSVRTMHLAEVLASRPPSPS